MQKIKYKNDNFEKHMKKNMNCTKDCEEYEKPSVMLQGTSVASDRVVRRGQVSQTVAPVIMI